MKEKVLPRFGDNPDRAQSAAALALEVKPSSINRLVNHGTGGSVGMIERVEKLLNLPNGTILGYTSGTEPTPRFRDLAGFDAAIEEAERRCKESKIQLSRRDLEFAGDVRQIPPPKRISADLLVQLALALAGDGDAPKPKSHGKK
jgi:hypothetical protein